MAIFLNFKYMKKIIYCLYSIIIKTESLKKNFIGVKIRTKYSSIHDMYIIYWMGIVSVPIRLFLSFKESFEFVISSMNSTTSLFNLS